jgi:hypothetical protein
MPGVADCRRKELRFEMTYTAYIETPLGCVVAAYDDDDIDRIGGLALLLRDALREGAYIAPSEIAAAAYRCEEEESA